MYKYILKRLLMMIPVLLGVMIAVFTITYFTPGDPARLLLGDGATKEAVEQVHEELGIDDPYIEQLGRYIGKIVCDKTADSNDPYQSQWAPIIVYSNLGVEGYDLP